MRLKDIGEDGLVERLTRDIRAGRDIVVGVGDDCAVVRGGRRGWYELLKTDCVVEGVHYLRETPPAKVGWKAMARCLSDMAAMGGLGRYALVTVVMPGEREVSYIRGVYRGLRGAADSFGVSIVGGETASSHGDEAVISVAMEGEVEVRRCVMRSGGKAGDRIYVTGRLGGSLRGKHLRFVPRVHEARWLTSVVRVHAMMDLSDGLAADLPRMADASGVGYEVKLTKVPRTRGCGMAEALGDGEDFELLFAISARSARKLEDEWKKCFPSLKLTCIGELREDEKDRTDLGAGWEHFARQP
ncbi:MAG: thiamine-phosphate kinase [Verrucomicrobiota bacterium]